MRCWRAIASFAVVFSSCGLVFSLPSLAAEFKLTEHADGVRVEVDGKLFTEYVKRSGAKPILYPLLGPSGDQMTRGYPIREPTAKEKKDHVHHRSFWFTHGNVNGISFWHENNKHGTIEHREFNSVRGGATGHISSTNDWKGPDGKRVCQDIRTYVFHADSERRWIDVEITVLASDGEVTFGDTKEGSFGVRVAGSMRTELPDGGKIVNSRGHTDGEAWGKQAEWVDYHGPVNGSVSGIAILNHPSSFRFPTYWHVRTYGLFAANPFGLHDFKRDKTVDGSHRLDPKQSFRLRYRVLLHTGDEKKGRVAEMFQQYSKGSGKP